MKSHRDHGRHVDYNLENVAGMLSEKYPDSNILVVRPAKMELKTFSCFINFVNCDNVGNPDHQPNCGALLHLATLLMSAAEQTGCASISARDSKLTLIGFSKGCVVLNQFLHEFQFFNIFHMPPEEETLISVLAKRIKKIIWLDGGHSGGKDTWVTSPAILSSFASSSNHTQTCLYFYQLYLILFIVKQLDADIAVDIHVTPYQVKDSGRPWIGKEEKQFYLTLKKAGVVLSRKLHFEEETASIENHFLLLEHFEK
jgi:hypothetical protein